MACFSEITCSRRPTHPASRAGAGLLVAALAAGWTSACVNPTATLTRLLEARRLTSDLHVEFTKAADAANRAVMAETDDASSKAAEEARRGRQAVARDIDALHPVLQSLGYSDDVRYLDEFKTRFDEYRRLDDEILPLAVENTNLKAQRLSFGPAREAAETFRASIDAAVHATAPKDSCRAEAVAARARVAVLEIQATHARHIAAAEDAVMTRMEAADDRVRRGGSQGPRRTAGNACAGGAAAARRGGCRAGSVHGDPRRNRHPVTPQQQRALARVVARPKAHGDCRMRGCSPGTRTGAREA